MNSAEKTTRLSFGWHTKLREDNRTGGSRYAIPMVRPHMIFAAGWRCGSTMLQRMLIAGLDKCVIWGEPWEEYEFHRTMMEQFLQHSDVHQGIAQTAPDLKSLPFSQTANMNPGFEHLREVHHAYWRSLLWNRQIDHTNFGVKWVHADKQVIRYFKFLFPQFRPLLLVRNPFDALASYMTATGEGKHPWCRSRRESYWIEKPKQFLREWYHMAQSFQDIQGEAQANSKWGSLEVFKYEGFLDSDGDMWPRLARYIPELNMTAARQAQAYRVNYISRGKRKRYEVPFSVRQWFLDKYVLVPFYDQELRCPVQ
jgi:hypothetical protein